MIPEKVNLAEKFFQIGEYWSPKIAGEINDTYLKLVKFQGEFVWHHHENEDELFLVVKGRMMVIAPMSCSPSNPSKFDGPHGSNPNCRLLAGR